MEDIVGKHFRFNFESGGSDYYHIISKEDFELNGRKCVRYYVFQISEAIHLSSGFNVSFRKEMWTYDADNDRLISVIKNHATKEITKEDFEEALKRCLEIVNEWETYD